MCKTGMAHQSRKLRKQSDAAICAICNKLQSKIEIDSLNEILAILKSALNTRTWNGKVAKLFKSNFVKV